MAARYCDDCKALLCDVEHPCPKCGCNSWHYKQNVGGGIIFIRSCLGFRMTDGITDFIQIKGWVKNKISRKSKRLTKERLTIDRTHPKVTRKSHIVEELVDNGTYQVVHSHNEESPAHHRPMGQQTGYPMEPYIDKCLILKLSDYEELLARALSEDRAFDDVTTASVIPHDLRGKASIVAKAEGVLAGIEVARAVFLRIDPGLRVEVLIADGATVRRGDIVACITGNVASILRAERTALNFLCHLSGIASETARYVEAVKGLKTKITDTRKTTPGLRLLEKYAVAAGGGHTHRLHLKDGILIKDNHLAALRSLGCGLKEVVEKARRGSTLKIEVEVSTIDEAREALEAGADIIMLDNMPVRQMRKVVDMVVGRSILEASGGVTLRNVRAVAETGVDFISVGALTHSAKALDLSLDIEALPG